MRRFDRLNAGRARRLGFCGAAAAAFLLAPPTRAQLPDLKPELEGLAFLVGHWTTPTRGQVQDTGGTSSGTTSFVPETDGAVLLRRDHVSLYDKAGAPAGGFDIIMMIYSEAGMLRADYADGTHIIHYASAALSSGRSVTFTSAQTPGTPTFRLAYNLSGPKMLSIAFAMAPPGSQDFHPIATGVAMKDD